MATIAESYGAALKTAGMDRHGMLPADIRCKQCGAEMNPNGHRPAELYAGTFTGLCYRCERGGAYVVEELDTGVALVSHPPHCPSWRRDRETFYWYTDCQNPKCRKGKITISRPYPQGGPYPKQCDECGRRHWDHPAQQARNRVAENRHLWYRRMQAEYSRRVKRAGGDDPDRVIAGAVLAEGPAQPTDETPPAWPRGWAKVSRRRRK